MSAIKTPEEYYGFKPGTARELVRWDKIVDYFKYIDSKSDKIKVVEVGKSTEENPMLVAYLSSPDNLGNLEGIREDSWKISHPKGLSDNEKDEIIQNGKAVVAMTMSIHASEVGGTQVVSDLVHRLITSENELERKIRQNVVLVLFPCANPDGQIMTVDWYYKWKGTEYEGCSLPWLYHKYTGHDNNRDALTLTQIETQIMNGVILKEWYPQAYVDHHQMGFYGSRFFIPPNSNPLNEIADPLVWTEQKHYGAQMAVRMASQGIKGVEQAAVFPADFMPGFSLVYPWLQICGMFTEAASVKLATPVYVHHHQLQPHPRGRPEYRASVNFNDPWKGGWWNLSDILEGQMAAAMATLEVAANNREMILRNMYNKATNAINDGQVKPPYAFLIPFDQRDPNTTYRFLKTLRDLTVEIHKATSSVKVGDVTYPEGTYVVFTSQTGRPFIISLLSKTLYRDSPWVRTEEGDPLMNYDFATQTMGEFKGVKVIEIDEMPLGDFMLLDDIPKPKALFEPSKFGYIIDARINDSFKAVNLLHKKEIPILRTNEEVKLKDKIYPEGMFYVPDADQDMLKKFSEDTMITFHALDSDPDFRFVEVNPLRVAIYQRYWGGNTDEGWTRWLLEQFYFDYETVKDDDVKSGLEEYDVLIIPSDSTAMITGEKVEEWFKEKFKGRVSVPLLPPEYKSGIGEEGVEKIKEFVENGGTVLALYDSCDFAIEKLELPIINTVKDKKPKEFHCPGSTIWTEIDNKHPLGYGMPSEALILLRGNHAYAVKQNHYNENYKVVVRFPEENMMESGWLIGEEHLSRKSALIEAKKGKGRVVLYGFAPQMRGMTAATFKLFFNALIA